MDKKFVQQWKNGLNNPLNALSAPKNQVGPPKGWKIPEWSLELCTHKTTRQLKICNSQPSGWEQEITSANQKLTAYDTTYV